MRTHTPLILIIGLAACQTVNPPDESAVSDDWTTSSPAPSFMEPTSDRVSGSACAYSGERWRTDANELLNARWADIGSLQVDGAIVGSADAFLALLDQVGLESISGQRAVLALNVALNDAGVYGIYADLASARVVGGASAFELLATPLIGIGSQGLIDMKSLNEGFAGCPTDWYTTCGHDLDHDGVLDLYDCDDLNPNVGTLLYTDDLSVDADWFNTTPQLDIPWTWGGASVYATDGGQQALVGQAQDWDDYVVYATVSAKGTEPGCGFDCAEACGEYVPDDCYTDWQALGLGILTMDITANGVATFHNSGAWDICFEGYLMWDNPDSQGISIGSQQIGNDNYRVPAQGSLSVYYGSWTTANGAYSPFLNRGPFWCYQNGTAMQVGTSYDTTGSLLPADIQEIIAATSDLDGDGVEDHADWAGTYGVQTQYNIWDYQQSHAAVVVGKRAASTTDGKVQVTLTVQNRGALAANATLEDVIPEDWSVVSCSDAPDAQVRNADNTLNLSWQFPLLGCTDGCSSFDELVITCDLDYNLHVDLDIVELAPASVTAFNSESDATSWSMPAAAFRYDSDSDGQILCGSSDRWRAGILARTALDADQDEGFHGYRCALAHNSSEDCYEGGHFLQIAEFEDEPEDDISTECVDDCPENTTFDQLARVNHVGAVDLAAGSTAILAFWAVGSDLMCEVEDVSGGLRADAQDDSFAQGTTGLSTLNMYGDFDDIRVCEAYRIPR